VRTRIKFCGMTRVEDVEFAAALGVDAVGLIFAPRSPRRIDLRTACLLRAALPPFVASVALTVDAGMSQLRELVQTLRPSLLQFHGEESPEDCAAAALPFLKAVPMGDVADAAGYAARYSAASGFVFDSHVAGGDGGGGRVFDWQRLPAGFARPLVLAGGLRGDNVFDAVRAVRPYAVDVSSGIESAPGVKDRERMRRFVAEVRRADGEQHG
jgi:phosphoribosylanthranilate isomerase